MIDLGSIFCEFALYLIKLDCSFHSLINHRNINLSCFAYLLQSSMLISHNLIHNYHHLQILNVIPIYNLVEVLMEFIDCYPIHEVSSPF